MTREFPSPKSRKPRWRWWLAGFAGLLTLTWVVLNHLLPVWAPMLVVRDIDLPGAKIRALARLMEAKADRLDSVFPPPTGETHFDSPWMRRTDEFKIEHFILPVQWSFRSFLRSGSKWEKRAVLGAASQRGCGECFPELVALLPEEEPAWRVKIVRALGAIATAEALGEVEKLASDRDPDMRVGVMSALSRLSRNPAFLERTLATARRLHDGDPSEPVRRNAAEFLLWQRIYGAPERPAVPFDTEVTALLRSSFPGVRQGVAESLCAASWHLAFTSAWLPEVERAWREDPDRNVKANAALVLVMEHHPLAPDALTYLESLCPPELRPLTEASLRDALARHLPYGLCFELLERDWKRH